jgi:hypothetical protein
MRVFLFAVALAMVMIASDESRTGRRRPDFAERNKARATAGGASKEEY